MEGNNTTGNTRSGTTSQSALLELLECPVCMDIMSPPLLQCTNGHMLCNDCRGKIYKCPQCKVSLNSCSRNRALESLAETALLVNCPNHGCRKPFKLSRLAKHSTVCEFAPMMCPHDESCTWSGSIYPKTVVKHLVDKHGAAVFDRNRIHQRQCNPSGIQGGQWPPRVYRIGSQYFLLSFVQRKGDEYFAIAVRQIIASLPLDRAVCSLWVAQNQRRLVWEGPVRSCREPLKEITDTDDCLTLRKSLALCFSDNECTGTEDISQLNLLIRGKITIAVNEENA